VICVALLFLALMVETISFVKKVEHRNWLWAAAQRIRRASDKSAGELNDRLNGKRT